MTRVGCVCALLALTAGCGAPSPDGPGSRLSDTRQIPSNTTPGVHVSGHVNVGVVRNF